MKFEQKYPDAQAGIPPPIAPYEDNVIKAMKEEQKRPCCICGDVTQRFHREFIVHLCSEECVENYLRSK